MFCLTLNPQHLNLIENLSKEFRNPAVHENSFDYKDLLEVRKTVTMFFNELLKLRPVLKSNL